MIGITFLAQRNVLLFVRASEWFPNHTYVTHMDTQISIVRNGLDMTLSLSDPVLAITDWFVLECFSD